MVDMADRAAGPVRTRKGREQSNEIHQLEQEKDKIEERIKAQRRRREQEIQDGEDWVGSDYSCCIFVPINIGIHLIGLLTALHVGLLVY